MRKSVLVMLMVLAGAIHIRAQSIAPSTINAAGGTATLAGNKYDWSVGEMTMVSTLTGSSVIVTQGVLQPYHYVPVSVSGPDLSERLQVFPNPATSVLNISYNASGKGALSYNLYDIRGSKVTWGISDLKQGTTTNQLDITPLACATYMLEVTLTDEHNVTQKATYKIEKIK